MNIVELTEKAVAEARADEARKCAADVCFYCNNPLIAEPATRWPHIEKWEHNLKNGGNKAHCDAGPIHERLHRETKT